MNNEKPATYTMEQARQKVKLGRTAFYEALHKGQIPALRIGRSWRILAGPFDRMLDGQLQ